MNDELTDHQQHHSERQDALGEECDSQTKQPARGPRPPLAKGEARFTPSKTATPALIPSTTIRGWAPPNSPAGRVAMTRLDSEPIARASRLNQARKMPESVYGVAFRLETETGTATVP